MRFQSACLVLSTLAITATAIPQPIEALARQDSGDSAGCLPQDDPEPKKRAAAVEVRNKGFVYGPSLIGEAAFFPNGTLGNARAKADYDLWAVDREDIDARIEQDVKAVQAAIMAVCNQHSALNYVK